MPGSSITARARKESRGLFLTFWLVALVTALIFLFRMETGLTRGIVTYLIPVVIAATQWGIVAALFAAFGGALASAFLFFPPYYSLYIKDPQEVINLGLYVFVALVVSQLAVRLRRQLETARQREIDLRDLYAFSRRLAVAFDVSDIHSAIEDHLATVMQRKVVLFAGLRETPDTSGRRVGTVVPQEVRDEVAAIASGERRNATGRVATAPDGEVWLVRAVSPKNLDFGVIAIDLGRKSQDAFDDLRVRVDAVLAEATATLERLGVAHAISEARMRSQTNQLREALIGSVSHELRTPLASILGAASVLIAAPALANEKKLQALIHDVHDEAERLNNDIQNLLDASRISSNGISPHIEWADPKDIVDSAIESCRRRLKDREVSLSLAPDLPLVRVDSVLVQQALVQIFDNAAKYSHTGSRIQVTGHAHNGRMILSVRDEGTGLTAAEENTIWEPFVRGPRHAATTNGSGLGLWIANAFIAANSGKMNAVSEGPGRGTTVAIELPVSQAAVPQMESDLDE